MKIPNMVHFGFAIDDEIVDVGVGTRRVVDELDSLRTGHSKYAEVHKARSTKHRLDLLLEMSR